MLEPLCPREALTRPLLDLSGNVALPLLVALTLGGDARHFLLHHLLHPASQGHARRGMDADALVRLPRSCNTLAMEL
jgi:hypothetical protein